MIRTVLLLGISFFAQLQQPAPPPAAKQVLEKSAHFAFADREYIFTVEMVKPGIPILNFVSTSDQDVRILAKNIRLQLENRKAAARLLVVEAGDFQQPMKVSAMTIHPGSSFGVRLEGDFGDARELYGVTIRLGSEDFKLAPMTSFQFETFVLKVNHLNLGSPDFSDDWRVLKLEPVGSRGPARRQD
jgi:hypothetical protein